VAPADAPRDWDDILAPRFTGKILIRDPLASGTMRAIFGMVILRSIAETGSPDRGFDWLRRLDAQTKEYVVNATLLLEKLGRREGLVTLWDLPDVLLEKQRGLPIELVFPASGTPVIDDAIGLVAGDKHGTEARNLIEWLGSVEAQRLAAEKAFRLPARGDIPAAELPAWARDVESRLVPAKMDWDALEREGPGWMATWDRTVRGRGKR
jgi:iron(III) transport system substrate-binding protein